MAFGHRKVEGRRLLLREIARRGPVPRVDLARHTGISRATVTSATADLLRGGLIEEAPGGPRGGGPGRGRPRVGLRIAGGARAVAGLKVSGGSISLVLVDFDGADAARHERAIPAGRLAPGELAGHVRAGLSELAARAGRRLPDISAAGVGLPGVVDARSGLVYWSPSLDRRNVPLGDALRAELGIAVHLDNDANLAAMAELAFGMGRSRSDFIVVTIEEGVGMGMVLGGQIYRGARGCGAEFGHVKVHPDGALCRCGQRGCLEAYVADYALVREASGAGGMDLAAPAGRAVSAVLRAARGGDPAARAVVDRAGRMFALGLANLVNIFDPELVILAGEQTRFEHLRAGAVIEEMRKSIVEVDKPPPDVVAHGWDDLMWARGAAAWALDFVRDAAVEEPGDA